MTFSSIPFLFYFLPLFIAAYFISPWKNATLLLGSLIFYAWGEPVFIFLLIASLVFNHVIGRAIVQNRNRTRLAIGIIVNLAVLGWYKYAGFAAAMLNDVLSMFNPDISLHLETHLPLGISFFTFQAMSLLVDLYRRDAEPPKNAIDTALYITMFPQLIAGPIVRYKAIAGQLRDRIHSIDKFADGAQIFILGLAQKVLLANTFAGPADAAFNASAVTLTAGAAWLGLGAYSLQIFFDFAGYSNMAIGMGKMFGFDLPRNFNFPYTAQSVTEFWRRWHMTLSHWFRDYLYIPLGGNRGSPMRTYLNLWIVFLLCGLWHGAAMTFIIWGAYHGAFLVLERTALSGVLEKSPRFFRHLYLPLVTAFGWVFFRAVDLPSALQYFRALAGANAKDPLTHVADIAPDGLPAIMALGVTIAMWPLVRELAAALHQRFPTSLTNFRIPVAEYAAGQAALALLFVASAASLAGGGYNPFIYFRF